MANAANPPPPPPPTLLAGDGLLPKAPVDPALLKPLNAPEAGLINDDVD